MKPFSLLRGVLAVLALLLAASSGNAGEPVRTALDDYVEKPDPSYGWSLRSSQPVYGLDGTGPQTGTLYILNMTSQTWRTASDFASTSPNKELWRHFLHIVVPFNAEPSTCLLIIEGGSNSSTPNDVSEYGFLAALAGCSIAYLQFVPNEPVRFAGESSNRTEDAIISYTLDKYLDLYTGTGPHPDPEWPLLLPMTKAAVRAMDAVQEFTEQNTTLAVDRFIVTGASKRGWTTWLTAAADPQRRVVGIAPMVIDVLNMNKQMTHHKNAYSGYPLNDAAHYIQGGYSTAVRDYTNMNVFDRLDTDAGRDLARIVDPFTYRDRLTMPKLIINSTGDQFFLPDAAKFYVDYLPGVNRMMYLPNTDHGLGFESPNFEALGTLIAFVGALVPGSDWVMPDVSWSFEDDGSIRVEADIPPWEVKVWQAHNPDHRDFRLQTLGPQWTSTTLTDPEGDGVYIAPPETPATGWRGFFVELVYEGGKLCSGLRVVPDTYALGQEPPDVKAPSFAGLAAVPAFAQAGQEVTLSFAASEPLAALPDVTVNGRPAAFLSQDGQAYAFTFTVAPDDPEGPAEVVIEGVDLAENPGGTAFDGPPTVYSSDPYDILGGILINNNRSATNTPAVSLSLWWLATGGPGVSRMRFSNDGAVWSAWERLADTRAYTLPAGPDGHRTVRVQYLDRANARSAVFKDYIRLDTTPPTGAIVINNGQSATGSPQVTLGLSWQDGDGAGVTRMRFSNNGSTWSPWEPPAAAKAWTLGGTAPGYYTVRVQYRDGADNVSERFSDYIRLDP